MSRTTQPTERRSRRHQAAAAALDDMVAIWCTHDLEEAPASPPIAWARLAAAAAQLAWAALVEAAARSVRP